MPKTIITKETCEIAKKEIKKLKNEGTIFKKLLSVKLAYENNIKQTAKFLNIYPVSIKNWAKLINENRIDLLKIGSKHKDGIKIKIFHKEQIFKWIEKNPNLTISQVREMVIKEFKITVSKSTIHNIMKNNFSYITPRKNHYKQESQKVDIFKKNSK